MRCTLFIPPQAACSSIRIELIGSIDSPADSTMDVCNPKLIAQSWLEKCVSVEGFVEPDSFWAGRPVKLGLNQSLFRWILIRSFYSHTILNRLSGSQTDIVAKAPSRIRPLYPGALMLQHRSVPKKSHFFVECNSSSSLLVRNFFPCQDLIRLDHPCARQRSYRCWWTGY